MLECKEDEYVYFHTNYTEKTSALVVELVVTREFNSHKTQASAGYTLCPIFEFGQTVKTAFIQSGTPRQISALGLDKASLLSRSGKTVFTYDMKDCPNLAALIDLVPSNTFVG